MTPKTLRDVAATMVETLGPATSADWTTPASGLDWSCHTTIEHVGSALDRYAMYLAGSVSQRLPFALFADPDSTPDHLLRLAELRALVLSEVARAASAETRGFHVFGRSDREGYLAMGCVEMLVHTDDLARSLGLAFSPSADLVSDPLARLFPWAPTDTDPWQTLNWATGRVDLPGHSRVEPDWAWHAAPRSEWDGTVKTRASYQ